MPPAHAKASSEGRSKTTLLLIIASVVAIVAIAAGGIAFGLSRSSTSHAATTSGGDGGGGSGSSSATSSTVPPLTVTSITPASSATDVAVEAPITVTFSEAVDPSSPRPTISPDVAGAWKVSGDTMTFQPAGGYLPYAGYTVTVPTTVSTPTVHKKKATLTTAFTSGFTVQAGSPLRVEQMLAELNYLPVQFVATAPGPSLDPTTTTTTPATTAPATSSSTAAGAATSSTSATTAATTPTTASSAPTAASTLAAEETSADAVVTEPEAGTLSWRFANTPSTLQALWTPGTPSVIDQGAIMAFENANGMKMDGIAGPDVWAALVKAVAARQITPRPYDYLVASKSEPETLTVYQNGASIYTSPANTGVAAAPTPDGTWPVYDRYASTTMTGTNPDGSTYHDPGIPWVAYFHGGDAVHGFNRGSYGVPQSVGCVELPPANAQVVWQYDQYGTLVTVTG